jgi:hypothetical protein
MSVYKELWELLSEAELKPFDITAVEHVDYDGGFYGYAERRTDLEHKKDNAWESVNKNEYAVSEAEKNLRNLLQKIGTYILEKQNMKTTDEDKRNYKTQIDALFECFVVGLLFGERQGQSGDEGVDGIIRSRIISRDDKLIQCKAGSSYRSKAAQLFREVLGTCCTHGFKKRAYLVGTWENFPSQEHILEKFHQNCGEPYKELKVKVLGKTQLTNMMERVSITRFWRHFLCALQTISNLEGNEHILKIAKVVDQVEEYNRLFNEAVEFSQQQQTNEQEWEFDDSMNSSEKQFMEGYHNY